MTSELAYLRAELDTAKRLLARAEGLLAAGAIVAPELDTPSRIRLCQDIRDNRKRGIYVLPAGVSADG